jgi:hypothetical protein
MPDAFKILRDLEMKAVGVDPATRAMQEGYFVSFRNVGLPIRPEDYARPFNPIGIDLNKPVEDAPAANPAGAEKKTDSEGVDTDKQLQDVTNEQRAYVNTFLLTDRKLRMSNSYQVMPGSSKVSDTWWAIIAGANGVPPKKDIDADLKAAYEAAHAVLMDAEGQPTDKYQRYTEFRDKYRDKVKAYNRAYSTAITDPKKLARFPTEGKIYHDEVDEAFDEWTGFGAKNEIERSMAILAGQGTDPAVALISRCKKRFENSLLNFPKIGNIPWTVMSPTTWYDPDNDDGWNDYSSTDFHTESKYKSSGTAIKAGGGFNLGLWSAGASFEKTDQQQSLNIQTSNLEVRFKYCVADVNRIGIDTSLLNLKNWFLVGDYNRGAISRGTMAQEKPEVGEWVFLPSLVTSLILVKDFSIKWDSWKSDWEQRSSQVAAGASVGWSVFAVDGKYSHRGESRDYTADAEGEWLRSSGIQLIGYVSEILPESPGLNSSDFMQ